MLQNVVRQTAAAVKGVLQELKHTHTQIEDT